MKEQGIVKTILPDGMCEVIVKRKTACGENCANCKAGCEAREQIFKAVNSQSANVGDAVIIEINTQFVLKSAFLVYVFPLIILFAIYFLVEKYYSEGISAIISVIAFSMVFAGLKIYDKTHKNDCIPQITEII